MNHDITYTNHLGETVKIGRYEDWHPLETDLHDYEYDYDTSLGYIPKPSLSAKEKVLKLCLWSETEKQGLKRRNSITDITDADVRTNKEGTLQIGEWYLKCMVIRSTKGEWHHTAQIMEVELTLLCKNPLWWKEVTREFKPSTTPPVGDFLDYEYDYEYDYTYVSESQSFKNDARHPSYFRLVIYGYAANPSIKIGENIYQVNINVPINGLLIIDSRDRSVVLINMYGDEESVYGKRLRGASGSGQYIFQPIEPGDSAVSWSQNYGFSLTICRDRVEPEWI